MISKTNDVSAIRRTRLPRAKLARLHNQSATTPTSATPLIIRCVNSMMVSMRGATGTTSPLHSGQWLPHPAPDPLARTYAPHSTTSTFHTERSPGETREIRAAACGPAMRL